MEDIAACLSVKGTREQSNYKMFKEIVENAREAFNTGKVDDVYQKYIFRSERLYFILFFYI